MKKLALVTLVGLCICGQVDARETSGMRQAANAVLPGAIGIGGAITTYEDGEAGGLSFDALYRLPTHKLWWPRYADLVFSQMSDGVVDLKNIVHAELFWEPVADSTFGFVLGGGGAAQNFGVEGTEWGYHYGVGVVIKIGGEPRVIVAVKDNDLKPSDATITAAYVIGLRSF